MTILSPPAHHKAKAPNVACSRGWSAIAVRLVRPSSSLIPAASKGSVSSVKWRPSAVTSCRKPCRKDFWVRIFKSFTLEESGGAFNWNHCAATTRKSYLYWNHLPRTVLQVKSQENILSQTMLTESNQIQRLRECNKLLIPGVNNLQHIMDWSQQTWFLRSMCCEYVNVWQCMSCAYLIRTAGWLSTSWASWNNSLFSRGLMVSQTQHQSQHRRQLVMTQIADGFFVTGCYRYTIFLRFQKNPADVWQLLSCVCWEDVFSRSTSDTFLTNIRSKIKMCKEMGTKDATIACFWAKWYVSYMNL